MSMVPTDDSFPRLLQGLVRARALPESRLHTSVRRILAFKRWLGLLDAPPFSASAAADDDTATAASAAHSRPDPPALSAATERLVASVGSDADRTLSLDAARASITLLLNRRSRAYELASACAAYRTTTTCSWTVHWACPGGASGDGGFAEDDGSVGFECCCGTARDEDVSRAAEGSDARSSGMLPLDVFDAPPYAADGGTSADGAHNTGGTSADGASDAITYNASVRRILVVGPAAHSLRMLLGGWTTHWQVHAQPQQTLAPPPHLNLTSTSPHWRLDDALAGTRSTIC
jgi:beta-glucosidase-like glycosyl hydrolase